MATSARRPIYTTTLDAIDVIGKGGASPQQELPTAGQLRAAAERRRQEKVRTAIERHHLRRADPKGQSFGGVV